ncbi:hypothetical protein [Clostridium botulinum]|uniref:hypothetical protein n=1 Tax=Clostridium botulinum TaxID=1491 RepID=UPI000992B539|nr:hypothetical protein [Clostridium botulinum]MCD3337468.1 hypothetical protein [Clostridium botulinum D/C]OOV61436.1 hypothetical protein B1A69_09540 [Clostridium botulinum D/C]
MTFIVKKLNKLQPLYDMYEMSGRIVNTIQKYVGNKVKLMYYVYIDFKGGFSMKTIYLYNTLEEWKKSAPSAIIEECYDITIEGNLLKFFNSTDEGVFQEVINIQKLFSVVY